MPFGTKLIRRLLEKKGYALYRRPWLPKGANALESISAIWPDWQPGIIFDVGANVGQTALELHRRFPAATIHAFEPVPDTFATLQAAVASRPRIRPHRLALSDRAGHLGIVRQSDSTLNSIHFQADESDGTSIQVQLETTDAFCRTEAVPRIDLLKIDVEGAELPVLRGAESLVRAGNVGLILAEAGLQAHPSRFTPLSELTAFLRPHGYWLVGIYEQHGWTHFHAAEFCNALFAPEPFLARPNRVR